jgi:hypothetical protein
MNFPPNKTTTTTTKTKTTTTTTAPQDFIKAITLFQTNFSTSWLPH